MAYSEIQLKRNKEYEERYVLSRDRIISLAEEKDPYFHKNAIFLAKVFNTLEEIESGNYFKGKCLEQLRYENEQLYSEVLNEYETSYMNPDVKMKYRRQLCFLASELFGSINYAFEKRKDRITVLMELFLEIYGIFSWQEDDEDLSEELNRAIYYYVCDYMEENVEDRLAQQLCPEASIYPELLEEMDDTKEEWLYHFGFYVGEDSRRIFNYLAKLPGETIEKMAGTFTGGYERGFKLAGISLADKETVNIRYFLGFERVVKEAVRQFEKKGLRAVIYPMAHTSIHRKDVPTGLVSQSPNRQWEYDHRMDEALYLDRRIVKRRLDSLKNAYAKYKKEASLMAGPAVMEVFGEAPFVPVIKPDREKLTNEQQQLKVEYEREAARIVNRYQPGDKRSFTIIAWPLPSIVENVTCSKPAAEENTVCSKPAAEENTVCSQSAAEENIAGEESGKPAEIIYEEIFNDTIRVNTLDEKQYEKIQQCMIDVLDKADRVRILGRDGNETDLTVNLWDIKDENGKTLFENCLSDVNIPVGEVFTSPRLTGTEGLLHVKRVFLEGLEYVDLKIRFKDGMVSDYSCDRREGKRKNAGTSEDLCGMETDPEGKVYIRENILKCHDTLPMGEFAIGTNTAAYAMGEKYGILSVLPILIAEKMGPHFAVGDTCYSMREEQKVYNPDKKEVAARENECSVLRHTDPAKAYFNCHTDITIPYPELGEISAVLKDGSFIKIIENSRFVLPGTEKLNEWL